MTERFLKALNGRHYEHGVVETTELRFLSDVVDACRRNICGKYNKCHTCPPAVGTLDECAARIKAYKHAFVFTTKHDLEDSFDFEGMTRGKDYHDGLSREIHDVFYKTNPVYGAGGCSLCEVCAYPEPCVNPERIFPSIEGSGINVTDLSKSAGVRYNNGENTVTYFSMILF